MSKVVSIGKSEYKVRQRGKSGIDVAVPIEWARDHGLSFPDGKIKWVPHPKNPDILMMCILHEEERQE